jgi:pyruvyltransferase
VLIIDIVHPRVDYLRPRRRYLHVIDQILQCEKIVSSSLHGLILADAYRVPAYWLQVGERQSGDQFKYEDYFGSVQRPTVQLQCQAGASREDILSRFKSYQWKFESQSLLDVCPFTIAESTAFV